MHEDWQKRAEKDMDAAQDMATARLTRLGRAYRQAEEDLTREVESLIGRYAVRMGLSQEDAERFLCEPVDEDSHAYGCRVTRTEALKAAAREQAEKPGRSLRGEMDAQWAASGLESAQRAGKLAAELGFISPNIGGVTRSLNMHWSGTNYSRRIWANTQELADTLDKEITAALMSGKTNAAIAQTIAERFNVSFRQAGRLVRAETSRVENQAAITRYAEA